VKLIAQLKLLPSPQQAELLTCMLTTVNAACDYISRVAWDTSVFREYALRKIVYADVRGTFGLGAQVAQHCVAEVADTYKVDKKRLHTFAPLGSIAFDDRNLSYNIKGSSVSIWTVSGRQSIPFVCGEHQRKLLETRQGESDLVFVRGNWYVLATCQVDQPEPLASEEVLGIDLGVTNIAVDSDGEVHSGKPIKNVRYRQRRLRNKLQRKGTKHSRRRLRLLAGQEARFAKHVNHVISKTIVAKAERTKRAIAVEDLTHIRTRVRARRSQRATLHSWSFVQLQAFIAYKAALVGVCVHRVDPRNTSRTCPTCGHCAKENRKTQSAFVCLSCGFAGLADRIAAENIRVLGRGAVSHPYCSDADGSVVPGQSPNL
jgi:putative transposase